MLSSCSPSGLAIHTQCGRLNWVWLEKKAASCLAEPAPSEETFCRKHRQHYMKATSAQRPFTVVLPAFRGTPVCASSNSRILPDSLDPQSKSLSDFTCVGAQEVQAQHRLRGLPQAHHLKATLAAAIGWRGDPRAACGPPPGVCVAMGGLPHPRGPLFPSLSPPGMPRPGPRGHSPLCNTGTRPVQPL